MARYSPTVRLLARGAADYLARGPIKNQRRIVGVLVEVKHSQNRPACQHVEGLRIANRPKAAAVVKDSSRQHTRTAGGGSGGTGQNPGAPLDGVVSRLRGHGDRFGQRRHRVYFFPAHIIGELRVPSWRTAAYPRAEKAQK